jgi:hypothetical protein
MRTGNVFPLKGGNVMRHLIWIAFGRKPAEQIEVALKCSRRQAQRIVSYGHVPENLRGLFYEILAEAIVRRQEEIRAANDVVTAYLLGSGLRTVAALAREEGDRGAAGAAEAAEGQSVFPFLVETSL